jgi:hypothetical protein
MPAFESSDEPRATYNPSPLVCRQTFFGQDFAPIALAAREPVVNLIQPTQRRSLPRTFKEKGASRRSAFASFAIWCGHTSSSTFRAIKEADNELCSDLLKRSKQVTDVFAKDSKSIEEITRSMYPCATAKAGHWSAFCETMAPQVSQSLPVNSVGGYEVDDYGSVGSPDSDEVIDERENSDSEAHPRSRGDALTREPDVGYATGESSSWFISVSDLTIELIRTKGKRTYGLEPASNARGRGRISSTPKRGIGMSSVSGN